MTAGSLALWFVQHLVAVLSVVFSVKAQSTKLFINKPNIQGTGSESNECLLSCRFFIDGS